MIEKWPARENKRPVPALVLVVVLTISIFVLDLATPLSTTEWAFYIVALLVLSMVAGRRYLVPYTAVCTLLVAVGFVLSSPGIDPRHAFFNRAMIVGIFWLTTALIIWRQRIDAERERLLVEVQETAAVLELTNNELQAQAAELEERESTASRARRCTIP